MTDRQSPSRELIDLVSEVKRGLRYYESLNLTEYSEVPSQDIPSPVPVTVAPEIPSQPLPVMVTPTHRREEQIMPSKKKPPARAQTSLFGEIAPEEPPAEPELPSNETLEIVRADIGDCTRCKLHPTRTHIVFGEGDPQADLIFVGEGPGADEDATGRPFVGRAGQLLDRMIESIGMKRGNVYIANIVKCRPPNNREPESDEVATCEPFLYRQIKVIQPKLVVALGGVAAKTLLRTKAPISKLRGQFFDFRDTKLMATFHPAFLLRSPSMKKEAWEDLKKVRDFLTKEKRK